ncbi:Rpn family recombination-promoting nuclease/putative transposase [Microcoleus sp. FACHB-SPT15]|uniref:Rpn family recombination-promoting nuclease/putative transposase n=1 Tax=Microcoleus sp. FACHB-SPT15 TaxID=2692830 RepID=UPI00177E3440|nr:Rpn family recombination-promoting nuclease/putative transposase [Microcoleus sp. FACHB-SPT15]MBD1809745.1 Rpn family recombination-promoting nuclease/putative transposase [Microcoleus sp. FACHB-SPT15]
MAYDNICKYLAEKYPTNFVRWLLSDSTTDIQVLKTELNVEPIRVDSLTLLQTTNQILHLEFQTLPASNPSLPFRMLDYWVRLYRQYRCPIKQVVIFLKTTTSEAAYTQQFEVGNTRHQYRVIRMWEQEPAFFMRDIALLPLAVLAQTDSPQALLEQVAEQVAIIESQEQRQNVSASVQILAGLRFEKELIKQVFREDIVKESVIYQEILQEGVRQGERFGRLIGRAEGEATLIIRQLTRRFGSVDPTTQERIQSLSNLHLEELSEALLDFSAITDLTLWLDEHQQ